MTSIRIIATPAGEAPENIRQAWIGLVLPLRDEIARPVYHRKFGVLTGPKDSRSLGAWFKRLFAKKRWSYVVTAKVAVELLDQHNPQAAQWWKEHAPHYLTSTNWLLAFEPEVCELVQ